MTHGVRNVGWFYANDNFDLSEMLYFLLPPSSVLLDSFVFNRRTFQWQPRAGRFLSRLVRQDGNPDRQIEFSKFHLALFWKSSPFRNRLFTRSCLIETRAAESTKSLEVLRPGRGHILPSFGLIAMVKDPRKTDGTLAEIAESLGISKKREKEPGTAKTASLGDRAKRPGLLPHWGCPEHQGKWIDRRASQGFPKRFPYLGKRQETSLQLESPSQPKPDLALTSMEPVWQRSSKISGRTISGKNCFRPWVSS